MEGCGEVNNDLAMESLVEETRLEVILMLLGIEMLTGKKPQNDTTTNSLVAVCCNGDWTDHLESSGDHLESSGASVGPPPRKRVKRRIVDPPFSECDDNCITNILSANSVLAGMSKSSVDDEDMGVTVKSHGSASFVVCKFTHC